MCKLMKKIAWTVFEMSIGTNEPTKGGGEQGTTYV
jgi:hypothetical protein